MRIVEENWKVLTSLFPTGWQRIAWRSGAVVRLRGFPSPDVLLRMLMLHVAWGYSLRERLRAKLANCRGDQVPCEEATVTPYAAEVNPELFAIAHAPVLVISAERTFWEKATILHREYYRAGAGKDFTERVFRHYDDLVVISRHPRGHSAMTEHSHLLDEVVAHKQHFVREGTAHYELAKRSTLRLAPSKHLEDGLRKDYEKMREMYFGREPDFDEVLNALRELEKKINES
jgi:hypothetical protein